MSIKYDQRVSRYTLILHTHIPGFLPVSEQRTASDIGIAAGDKWGQPPSLPQNEKNVKDALKMHESGEISKIFPRSLPQAIRSH